MYSSLTSPPVLSPRHRHSVFDFSSFTPKHLLRRQLSKISVKFSHKPQTSPLTPSNAGARRFLKSSRNSVETLLSVKQEEETDVVCRVNRDDGNILKKIGKPIAFALFVAVIGFCPISGFQDSGVAAIAAPVVMDGEEEVITAVQGRKTEEKAKDLNPKRQAHEYSNYTRTLLETVSVLLRSIEEVRSGNGDIKKVELALREVKLKKKALQAEIMDGLQAELRVLKREKDALVWRSEEIVDAVMFKARREKELLLEKMSSDSGTDSAKELLTKLDEEISRGEKEYNDIWERVGEINDHILRRETMAFSIGIRELSFIARESELLVDGFTRQMRRQRLDR